MTISLKGSNLRYAIRNNQIVNDVTIEASSSEIIGIFGPNGAGKTTTFHILSGIIPTSSGNIQFDGIDITKKTLSQRAKLGLFYLPQDNSVFRELTVRDNLFAAVETRKDLSHGQQMDIVDETIEKLNLQHITNSMAKTVSGGERRRVEIGRLLVLEPKMIMLDEPFAGVDPVAVNDIQKIVLNLKKQGVGIVITDHNVRETLTFCDRGYVMHKGSLIAEGSPKDIISCHSVKAIYLGNTFS
ncbi:MAG: LPS export ABC transporter ATP-binding protein [Pseudomonadota bacterium]|nr:LPS export ABC transporter ATP-binding protein [Pseudomonadota bacterium]